MSVINQVINKIVLHTLLTPWCTCPFHFDYHRMHRTPNDLEVIIYDSWEQRFQVKCHTQRGLSSSCQDFMPNSWSPYVTTRPTSFAAVYVQSLGRATQDPLSDCPCMMPSPALSLYSGHMSGFLSLVLLRLLACHLPTLLGASIKSSSIRVTTSHHLQIGNRISITIGQTTLLRNLFLWSITTTLCQSLT